MVVDDNKWLKSRETTVHMTLENSHDIHGKIKITNECKGCKMRTQIKLSVLSQEIGDIAEKERKGKIATAMALNR